jgi:hypothetical protein
MKPPDQRLRATVSAVDPIRDLDLVRVDDPRVSFFRAYLRAHDRYDRSRAKAAGVALRSLGISVCPVGPKGGTR